MPVRRRLLSLAASIVSLAILGACTSPPGTIIREKEMPAGGQLITTDARQRAITSHRVDINSMPGVVLPTTITCVEPQPSVALAMANSLGAGLSVLHYGSGALSSAVSENAFQLEERTIAIQALLNASYQNCLDYSNGAITNTFYAIRASNLDNLLVTMALASEAAGNLRSNLGSASTEAAAEAEASQSFLADSVDDIQKSAKALGDARRSTVAARETLVAEKAQLADATEARKKAEADQKQAVADGKTGASLESFNTAVTNTKATEAKEEGEVKDAQAKFDAAEREQNDIESAMLNKVDATASASAAGRDVKGAGGVSGRPTDAAVLAISEMQRRFMERSTSGQYITACLVEMGLSTVNTDKFDVGEGPKDLGGPDAAASADDLLRSYPALRTFERELWGSVRQYLERRIREYGTFEQHEADVFKLFARSERSSMMTKFCRDVLHTTVEASQKSEHLLAMERVKNERLQTAVHLLEVRALVSQQCEAVKGKDDPDTEKLRAACLVRLESIDEFIRRELS